MRRALLIVGVVMLLMGVLWIGQGTGVFPYPHESFMIDERPWAWRGVGLAIAGLLVVLIGRRKAR